MKSLQLRSLLVLVLVLVFSVPALAQRETGQISGTVTDPHGAVVPDAKVTVKSTTTGLTREAMTNTVGIYTIASLPADTYEVTIEKIGFEKFIQRVQVAVGSTNNISAKLTIGATATTIVVSESLESVSVNTETQTLSQIVTPKEIELLPTSPTRNPYLLVAISGNVAEDNGSARGTGFSINGQRSSSTSILLDGAENVDAFNATIGQQVPLDSVDEFSVLTNNFTAEYGRASGGVVNVITKSGTNTFHGSAYEFNRVSALSSNTFQNNAYDITKPVFDRNDFGFSLGGPVIKNKLFFFDNTEWIRVRSSAPTEEAIIDPGSIAQLAPASQAFFTQYGKLAPGTNTLSTLPCGYATLVCDVVSYSVASDAGGGLPQNTWMEVAKIDYLLSQKTTLSGRYAAYNEMDFVGSVSNSPYAGYNTGENIFNQNMAITLTHTFSTALVNSTKLVYNRINTLSPLGTAPVGPTLFTTPTTTDEVGGFPLVFPGYVSNEPGEALPFGGPQNLYQVFDDVSWFKGKHHFKFGGQYIQIRDDRTFGAYMEPIEALGSGTLQAGLANLTSGYIYEFEGAVNPQGIFPCPYNAQGVEQVSPACTLTLPATFPQFSRSNLFNDFALYVQDSWKVVPRLTANLGLRWEYYGVQHDANPNLDANFVLGSGANFFEQIRNATVETSPNGGVLWKPDYKNFGPRVGFAYDLFGNGSTAIRGGYSIGYERNFGNVTFNAMFNPPNYAVVDLISGTPSYPGNLPVYTTTFGPLAGTGSAPLPPSELRAINQNIKTAYAQTWSLGIDHRVTKNAVLELSYSGSHGVHLYDIANINIPGSGNTYMGDTNPGNDINYQYGSINYRSDNGFNHYEAMNVKYSANNLWNKGLGVTVNYTWSHTLDNLSSTFTDALQGTAASLYQLGYLDAFNPRLNWGNSDYDIRHRVVITESWELPWMKTSRNWVGRGVLGGWTVGSLLNIHSGSPFTIYDCTNFVYGCPLYVPGGPIATSGSAVSTSVPNTFNYITIPNQSGAVLNLGDSLGIPNCTGLFHQGCTYTISGLPYPERNQFSGPGYWNLNMNFTKNFKLKESLALQFRAEMYNILNHSNQYINQLNLDVSSMPTPYVQSDKGGLGGYAGTPFDERRNIEFALKLSF